MGKKEKELGALGEQLAREFLERKGYWILAQNYRCKQGEIDLIAENECGLYFVEVKTRQDASYGRPCESVTAEKQKKLQRIARWYAKQARRENVEMHIDVVEVMKKDGRFHIHHIKDAVIG